MKSFFDPDSPLAQFLFRIMDLCIINVLMLICCIPIVTIGPAVAAAHKTTQDMVFDTGSGVAVPFFRAFKANFKQAIVVWLCSAALIAGLFGYYILVGALASGVLKTILYVILAIFAIVALLILSFLYPMMTRYENKLIQHFRNAILLVLLHLPRGLVMVAVSISPLVLALISWSTFLQFGFFWLIIGLAFLILIQSYLMKSIFVKLEEQQALNQLAAETPSFVDDSEAEPEE